LSPVSAGTMTALAFVLPSYAFSVEMLFGSMFELLGETVSQRREPGLPLIVLGTTVTFSE
jgi:hypothetical protein